MRDFKSVLFSLTFDIGVRHRDRLSMPISELKSTVKGETDASRTNIHLIVSTLFAICVKAVHQIVHQSRSANHSFKNYSPCTASSCFVWLIWLSLVVQKSTWLEFVVSSLRSLCEYFRLKHIVYTRILSWIENALRNLHVCENSSAQFRLSPWLGCEFRC